MRKVNKKYSLIAGIALAVLSTLVAIFVFISRNVQLSPKQDLIRIFQCRQVMVYRIMQTIKYLL